MKSLKMLSIALIAGFAVSALAQRAPTVTYTVSGSANNWTLNFDVTNNFNPGEGQIYFFGVLLDTGNNIGGSPSNGLWNPNTWTSWNNSGFGGSSTVYNNNWIDLNYPTGTIYEQTHMNGFQAISGDTVAPTSVQFFAYMVGGTYQGTGNFNSAQNPGFEGVATQQSVPEPAELGFLALGVLPLLLKRRAK